MKTIFRKRTDSFSSNLQNLFASTVGSLISVLFYSTPFLHPERLNAAGGDLFHNLWTWKRNIAFFSSFNSNYLNQIGFPSTGSAFWGEFQLGDSLVFQLFHLLGISDLRIVGLMLLIGSLVSFIFVYSTLRLLGIKYELSIFAAIGINFFAYKTSHLTHLQLFNTYWVFGFVYFFLKLRFKGERRKSNIIFLYAFALSLFCGPSYHIAGLIITLLIIFSIYVFNQLLQLRFKEAWFQIKSVVFKDYKVPFTVTVFAVLSTIPVWLQYLHLALNMQRRQSVEQVIYKQDVSSLFASPQNTWFYSHHLGNTAGFDNLYSISFIFFGFTALFYIGLAIYYLLAKSEGMQRHLAIGKYLFLASFFLLFISLGNPITFQGSFLVNNPIFLITSKLGLLSSTRYIAQFSYYAFILAILGATFIVNVYSGSWKNIRIWLVMPLLSLCVVLENAPYQPNILPKGSSSDIEWNFLRDNIEQPGVDTVAILPGPVMPLVGGESGLLHQYIWMNELAATPLKFVGGQSGFFPQATIEMMNRYAGNRTPQEIVQSFESEKAGFSLVLVQDWLDQKQKNDWMVIIQDTKFDGKYKVLQIPGFTIISR